jgi:hypothetical protein
LFTVIGGGNGVLGLLWDGGVGGQSGEATINAVKLLQRFHSSIFIEVAWP